MWIRQGGRRARRRTPKVRIYYAFVLAMGIVWHAPQGSAEERVTVLPVVAHIAQADGQPVVDRAFVGRQLASANRIFAPYAVQFVLQEFCVGPAPTKLSSRRDRDRLADAVRPRVINWFVVASLRDVDEPSRMRRGVHWHRRDDPDVHYVIVAAYAQAGVLAHELGHFLGNRAHSKRVGNLMSYDWRTDTPVLDRTQQRRLARAVSRYLRTEELQVAPLLTQTLPRVSPFAGW